MIVVQANAFPVAYASTKGGESVLNIVLFTFILVFFACEVFLLRMIMIHQMNQMKATLLNTSNAKHDSVEIRPILEKPIVLHESSKQSKN